VEKACGAIGDQPSDIGEEENSDENTAERELGKPSPEPVDDGGAAYRKEPAAQAGNATSISSIRIGSYRRTSFAE